MLKILSLGFLFPTARPVRDDLEKALEMKILITKNPEMVSNHPFLRFGNATYVNINRGKDLELNSQRGIVICARKKVFSEIMKNNGIPSPEFSRYPSNTFPQIHRSLLSSYHGKGMTIVNTKEDANRVYGGWWTDLVKISREFRVHVLGGKCVKIFEKKGDAIIKRAENSKFSKRDPKYFEDVYEYLNKKVNPLIPADYFALDIGFIGNTRNIFVFEANSAPGLASNSLTRKMYVDFLVERIKERL